MNVKTLVLTVENTGYLTFPAKVPDNVGMETGKFLWGEDDSAEPFLI